MKKEMHSQFFPFFAALIVALAGLFIIPACGDSTTSDDDTVLTDDPVDDPVEDPIDDDPADDPVDDPVDDPIDDDPVEDPIDDDPVDDDPPVDPLIAYYAPADGLSGEELKAALHEIIDDHSVWSYDSLKTVFKTTDADPLNAGKVIQFYTGESTTSDYNREHVWAKNHGDFGSDDYPAYSDMHHMRATDLDINTARGDLDFDEGGELIEGTECRIDGRTSFEPRNKVKGDVARALFYMAVRYNGDETPSLDLYLVEDIPSRPYYLIADTPAMGKLSTLLAWHIQDPPDAAELLRNDIIFDDYQHNRNPFIDHPEWVAEIW